MQNNQTIEDEAEPGEQNTELFLQNPDGLSDLSFLADQPYLTTLSLINCSKVSDLSPLAGLIRLTTPTLSNIRPGWSGFSRV